MRKKYNYDLLVCIAKKYNTRSAFLLNDPAAYQYARRHHLLDKLCNHMISAKYSSPQLIAYKILSILFPHEIILYNTRSIIKPLELDIYMPKYKLAIECNGIYWHPVNYKNDLDKHSRCISENILLITIYVKNNSFEYITHIKNELIKQLPVINAQCNTNKTAIDILKINDNTLHQYVDKSVLNESQILNIVNKYDTISDFIKNEPNLYQRLSKMKLIKKYTSNLSRKRKYWSIEKIKIEISKYTFLDDFRKHSSACYQHILLNDLSYLLDSLIRTKKQKFTLEKIQSLLNDKKYNSTYQFKKENPSAYRYVCVNKLLWVLHDSINKQNHK